MQEAKKRRLNGACVGQPQTDAIYVNNHLNPEFKRLLGATRAAVIAAKWAYVWYANEKVLVRKAEGDKALVINTLSDVEQIK